MPTPPPSDSPGVTPRDPAGGKKVRRVKKSKPAGGGDDKGGGAAPKKKNGTLQQQIDDAAPKHYDPPFADPAAAVEILKGWSDADIQRHRPCCYAVRAKGPVFRMEVMDGGRPFTGGPKSGDVSIFHPHSGRVERTLGGAHDDSVLAIAFTPNGVFTGGADGRIVQWSNEDLLKENIITVEGLVTALIYMPHLAHLGLFSAGDALQIQQWNIDTAELVATIVGPRAPTNHLCADDTYVYAACSDGSVCVFEVVDREMLKRVPDVHEGDAWCIEKEGDLIVTCGADCLIKLFNITGLLTNTPLSVLTGHRTPVRELQLYETLIFSTGHDGFVAVWDAKFPDKAKPIEVLIASVPRAHQQGRIAQKMGAATTATTTGAAKEGGSMDFSDLAGVQALTQSGQQIPIFTRPDPATVKTFVRPWLSLNLEGNELAAAGMDGVVVKWNVGSLLPTLMEVMEVPPLVGGVDEEHDKFRQLPIQERHEILSRREARRAIPEYTELPINYIVDSLFIKVKGSRLNTELLPFVLFITLFTVFVISDYSVLDVFNMTYGIEQGIDTQSVGGFRRWETFPDIYAKSVFEAFLTNSLVANLFAQTSNPQPSYYSSFRFVGQNELASSIRFRTQRVKPSSCGFKGRRFRDGVLEEYRLNETCYGALSLYSGNQDTQPYACIDPRSTCVWNATALETVFNFSSGMFEFLPGSGGLIIGIKYYGSGGYVVDIPGNLGATATQNYINLLMSNGFYDDVATRMIAIEYFHYNAQLDVFVADKLVCEILQGGYWKARMIHNPFKVFAAKDNVGRLVFEAFFVMFVGYWIFKFFHDGYLHRQLYGSVSGYLLDIWALLEFVNIVLFVTSFGARWSWYSASKNVESSVRPFDTSTYPQELEALANTYLLQLYVNSVNIVLVYIKILKYMQLNDKLNMLNRTLSLATSNIIGVLFLFVYFVFAFALCGYMMYGGTLYPFRTVDASYNQLLRLLVGDFDYDSMSDEAPAFTVVFHWSFVILSQFLLLNFLIAVLGDAFGEAADARLPVPIDDAIVRAASEVVRSLSVRALRITVVLWLHRRSRTDLTAEYAASMRSHRDSLVSDDARRNFDYSEVESHYITRDYFMASVPELLRTSENLNFMDEVWYDLAWEHHYRLRERSAKEAHEQAELIDEVLDAELHPIANTLSQAVRMINTYGTLVKQLQKVDAGQIREAAADAMPGRTHHLLASVDVSEMRPVRESVFPRSGWNGQDKNSNLPVPTANGDMAARSPRGSLVDSVMRSVVNPLFAVPPTPPSSHRESALNNDGTTVHDASLMSFGARLVDESDLEDPHRPPADADDVPHESPTSARLRPTAADTPAPSSANA